jgi:hypothetical protein
MALTYRLHQDDDLPALQELWEENTNWGLPTQELWQQYVIDAPLGGATIVVAEDEQTGQMVGEFVFVPSLVSVSGREFRAFRLSAPIVAKSLRFRSPNPFSHPVVAMYRYAAAALRARGDGLIYTVPDPRWVRFFRMFPDFYGGTYPLWRLDLPLTAPLPMPADCVVSPLHQLSGKRIDRLWNHWSKLHDCQVVRDSRCLPWKIGKGEYIVLGVERQGELIGLAASRRKGDRQWLICDVMAVNADEALRATLIAVSNLAHEQTVNAPPEQPLRKVALLVTPLIEPVARRLGYVRDEYDFPVVVQVLNPAISKEDIAPSKWYVSAND